MVLKLVIFPGIYVFEEEVRRVRHQGVVGGRRRSIFLKLLSRRADAIKPSTFVFASLGFTNSHNFAKLLSTLKTFLSLSVLFFFFSEGHCRTQC